MSAQSDKTPLSPQNFGGFLMSIPRIHCGQCFFWESDGDHEGRSHLEKGVCHRYPPIGGNPARTVPSYWCAEAKLKDAGAAYVPAEPLNQNVDQILIEDVVDVKH